MNGLPSLTNEAPVKTADDWISVFQQRAVWHLTRDIVQRWIARNAAFFDMLRRRVPLGGTILELGCGPGRHALAEAILGYDVVGIDVDPLIVRQAQANARLVAPEGDVTFRLGDMFNLHNVARPGTFQAITHGGVMEHLESAASIREALNAQLDVVPIVIFDVPVDTPKNRDLFARDEIFRQLWTPDQWVHEVLAGLPVAETLIDFHQENNMTDDLVVALVRRQAGRCG